MYESIAGTTDRSQGTLWGWVSGSGARSAFENAALRAQRLYDSLLPEFWSRENARARKREDLAKGELVAALREVNDVAPPDTVETAERPLMLRDKRSLFKAALWCVGLATEDLPEKLRLPGMDLRRPIRDRPAYDRMDEPFLRVREKLVAYLKALPESDAVYYLGLHNRWSRGPRSQRHDLLEVTETTVDELFRRSETRRLLTRELIEDNGMSGESDGVTPFYELIERSFRKEGVDISQLASVSIGSEKFGFQRGSVHNVGDLARKGITNKIVPAGTSVRVVFSDKHKMIPPLGANVHPDSAALFDGIRRYVPVAREGQGQFITFGAHYDLAIREIDIALDKLADVPVSGRDPRIARDMLTLSDYRQVLARPQPLDFKQALVLRELDLGKNDILDLQEVFPDLYRRVDFLQSMAAENVSARDRYVMIRLMMAKGQRFEAMRQFLSSQALRASTKLYGSSLFPFLGDNVHYKDFIVWVRLHMLGYGNRPEFLNIDSVLDAEYEKHHGGKFHHYKAYPLRHRFERLGLHDPGAVAESMKDNVIKEITYKVKDTQFPLDNVKMAVISLLNHGLFDPRKGSESLQDAINQVNGFTGSEQEIRDQIAWVLGEWLYHSIAQVSIERPPQGFWSWVVGAGSKTDFEKAVHKAELLYEALLPEFWSPGGFSDKTLEKQAHEAAVVALQEVIDTSAPDPARGRQYDWPLTSTHPANLLSAVYNVVGLKAEELPLEFRMPGLKMEPKMEGEKAQKVRRLFSLYLLLLDRNDAIFTVFRWRRNNYVPREDRALLAEVSAAARQLEVQPEEVKAAPEEVKAEPAPERGELRAGVNVEAAQMQAAMSEALTAVTEQKGLNVSLAPGAERAEMRLTDLILSLGKQGVKVPEVIPNFGDKGLYIAQYDETLISGAIHEKNTGKMAQGVVIVAMVANAAEGAKAKQAFGTQITIVEGLVNDIVKAQAEAVVGLKELKGNVWQVLPSVGVSAAMNLAAFLKAGLLANGGVVVVNTKVPVVGAIPVMAAQMTAAYEAAEAIGKSA